MNDRIKERATIAFLKSQLKTVVQDKGRKRYRATLAQKVMMALLYRFLGFPKKLCYTFKPATLMSWYRNRVKRFWTFSTNRGRRGRPKVERETIALIIRMKRDNPTWGARRISAELMKLDITLSKSKAAELLNSHGLSPDDIPSLTWSRFIKSHINSLIGCDFKTVTTIFGVRLYVLFFISYKSREIIHFKITAHPTKSWMKQQLRNLRYSLDHDDKLYLIRDNDILYRYIDFERFNIKDVPIVIRSPNMNAVTERFIGSFKREALSNFIIFNENQLKNITKEYVNFYNRYRPHQGLGNITIHQQKSGKLPKVASKVPTSKVKKQSYLCGYLNHYYYADSA